VVAARQNGEFATSASDSLNRGITDSTYWARLQIVNPDPAPRTVILSHDYAPTDDVRLFLERGTGEARAAGDSVPLALGTVRNRVAAFTLELAPLASQVVFLRVATQSNLNLEMSLWPPAQFQWHEQLVDLPIAYCSAALPSLCCTCCLRCSWPGSPMRCCSPRT
jgi:hypothetical protein